MHNEPRRLVGSGEIPSEFLPLSGCMLEMLLEIKFRRLSIFSSTLAVILGLWEGPRALVSPQLSPCSASAAEMMPGNIVFLSDVGVMRTPALGALLIGFTTSSVDHQVARRI